MIGWIRAAISALPVPLLRAMPYRAAKVGWIIQLFREIRSAPFPKQIFFITSAFSNKSHKSHNVGGHYP